MTTATKPPTAKLRPWPLTVDRYLRMIEVGILTHKDRVWLWKGRLVEKMTKGRPHTVAMTRLHHALIPLVAGTGDVEQEAPMRLLHRDDTLPEPDLKVIRGRLEDYATTPTTRDVFLVIEVADSSLADDQGEILELYAAEAIPVYWIANTVDRQIEVFTGPTGPGDTAGYAVSKIYRPGERVPVVLDGVEVGQIDVGEIFPDNDPWR
jgi:hypothetical protein